MSIEEEKLEFERYKFDEQMKLERERLAQADKHFQANQD